LLGTRERAPRHIDEIARCTGVPRPYLAKIIGRLSRAGLVATKRGYRGGVSLQCDPQDIPLLQVVEAVEGPEWLSKCLLGMEACDVLKHCPTRKFWARFRREVTNELRRTTMASVLSLGRSVGKRCLPVSVKTSNK